MTVDPVNAILLLAGLVVVLAAAVVVRGWYLRHRRPPASDVLWASPPCTPFSVAHDGRVHVRDYRALDARLLEPPTYNPKENR